MRSKMLCLVAVASAVACQKDPTAPEPGRQDPALAAATATPHFLQPAAGAPSIANPVVRFYAKRGQTRTAFMMYHAARGSKDSTDFVRFKVGAKSLLRRPNGTLFHPGDSVLITIKLVDPSRLTIDFQPAGLRFDPNEPAELRMNFTETDDDLNHDGAVNGTDATLTRRLRLWRRESTSQPWFKTPSQVVVSTHEVEGPVSGFTRYAIAY